LLSEHLVGDGQKMFEHAAKLNWEGIISKRADAPYRSERNENWLKIKAVQKGKFPVVGFVKDPTGVASSATHAAPFISLVAALRITPATVP
jgi:bifunctional non-homologous end joining protein LigD